MPHLGKRSRSRLKGVHPKLVSVLNEWLGYISRIIDYIKII